MIEGLVLEVEGVDRGDMQIPLPPYAIVVGSWDGIVRKCAATQREAAHDRDARRWRLRRAAPPAPGFFRQTNARAAWRARPVDDGSYGGDRALHWQTGSALRAVSL